jgi:hypothetical protein
MPDKKLTELPIATAATSSDVLYIVNDYTEGDPVLTGDSKQIYFSSITESIVIDPFPYTGDASITGNLTVTGNINEVKVSRGGGDNGNNLAVGTSVLANNTPGITGDTGRYNVGYGVSCLMDNTTGYGNTAIGYANQVFIQTGSENSSLGFQPLFFISFGDLNTAIGSRALYTLGNSQPTSQNNNTAIGASTGRYISSGTTALNSATGSTFIGYNTRALGNGQTNQVVIGNSAVGNGSNTSTIGNSSTDSLYLGGKAGEGIVMKSPDGSRYRITIANGGTLTITELP